MLYVFDSITGSLENTVEVSSPSSTAGSCGREVIGISHHPNRSVVVTITDDGVLKTWRP